MVIVLLRSNKNQIPAPPAHSQARWRHKSCPKRFLVTVYWTRCPSWVIKDGWGYLIQILYEVLWVCGKERAFNRRKDKRKFASAISHLSPSWIYHHLPQIASLTDILISSYSQYTGRLEIPVLSSRLPFLSPEMQPISIRSRILLGLFWSRGLPWTPLPPLFPSFAHSCVCPWWLSSGQALHFLQE